MVIKKKVMQSEEMIEKQDGVLLNDPIPISDFCLHPKNK